MAGSALQPVRRSPREFPRRRVTAFEAVLFTLAVFMFCATSLGQFRSSVNGPPDASEPRSLIGPLVLAALVASPALLSLGLRALLRRR